MIDLGGVYQYIAIGFGGLFLVPQIMLGYRTGSLKDVSTVMLVFIICLATFDKCGQPLPGGLKRPLYG